MNRLATVLLGLGLMLWPLFGAHNVQAAKALEVREKTLKCGTPGASISESIRNADPRQPLVLTVLGTCIENAAINASDVTIRGQAGSELIGQVRVVGGHRVAIENIAILGGQDGVVIDDGGSAILRNVRIENHARYGVLITRNSTAFIEKSRVKNNGGVAIFVTRGSSAELHANPEIQSNVAQGNLGEGAALASSDGSLILLTGGNVIKTDHPEGLAALVADGSILRQRDGMDRIQALTASGRAIATRNLSSVALSDFTVTGQIEMSNHTTLLLRKISDLAGSGVITGGITLTGDSAAYLQFVPPQDKGPITLHGDLACSDEESSLYVAEGTLVTGSSTCTAFQQVVGLNAKLGELRAEVDRLVGQKLDERLKTVEEQKLDKRLKTIEEQKLDSRFKKIEAHKLDQRLSRIERQSLNRRLKTIEGQKLDSRVGDLEARVTRLDGIAPGANLVGADLTAAELAGSDLRGANLVEARLDFADLSDANLSGAELSGVTCRETRFDRAKLAASRWILGVCPSTSMQRTDLSEADLRSSVMRRSNFRDSLLTGADLRRADFAASIFNNAVLAHVRLEGTVLRGASFTRADMTNIQADGADFSGAALDRAALSGSLISANLAGASLTDARVDADLRGANLTNATLLGAVVGGSRFEGVVWGNTICPDGTNSDEHAGTCELNLQP